MNPQDPQRERDLHDLTNDLTVLAVRAQLLRRRLGRAAGLNEGERAAMLSNLESVLDATRDLSAQVAEVSQAGHAPPADTPTADDDES